MQGIVWVLQMLGACGVNETTLDVTSSDSQVDGSASDVVLGASVVDGSASNVVLGACDVDENSSDVVLGASVVDESDSGVGLGASGVDGSASDVGFGTSGVYESASDVVLGASQISHLDTRKEFDISTLWLNLSSSEVNELLQHGVDPSEMDKKHGLTQQKGRQTLNSGIYKPGKVTKMEN